MQDVMLFSYWIQLFHSIHFSFDPFVWFYLTGLPLLGSYYYLYRNDRRFQKTFTSFLVYFVLQFLSMCYCLRHYYTSSSNAFFFVLSFASIFPIYFYLKESDKEQTGSVFRFLIVLSYLLAAFSASLLALALIFSVTYWILFFAYNHDRAKLFPDGGNKVSYLWIYALAGLFLLMGSLCYTLPMEHYELVSQDPTVKYHSFPAVVSTYPPAENSSTDNSVLYQISPQDIAIVTRIIPQEKSLFHREMEFSAEVTKAWVPTSMEGYFLQDNQWYCSNSFAFARNPNIEPSIPEQFLQITPPKEVLLLPPPRKVSQYVIVTTYHLSGEKNSSLEGIIRYRSLLVPYENQYTNEASISHSFFLPN